MWQERGEGAGFLLNLHSLISEGSKVVTELIRAIIQVNSCFHSHGAQRPKATASFPFGENLAFAEINGKELVSPCGHKRGRLLEIVPQPSTLSCFHVGSTRSLLREDRHQEERDVLHPSADIAFPPLAPGHPVIHPLPRATLPFRRQKPKQVFWWSLSLAGRSAGVMQMELPPWATGIQFQREAPKKWVIMDCKVPGKYLTSCAATEGAIKRKKPFIFFHSHLLAVLNVSSVNRMI